MQALKVSEELFGMGHVKAGTVVLDAVHQLTVGRRLRIESDFGRFALAGALPGVAKLILKGQIAHLAAVGYLRGIVENELKGLFLKPSEKKVLEGIGKKGQARPSDFKEFSLRSMQDFSSNYLTKLYNQNLLVRRQEGRAVNYRLRGIAQLSHTFGLLTD